MQYGKMLKKPAFVERNSCKSNSTKKIFHLETPDGYYLTITEFHRYEVKMNDQPMKSRAKEPALID